MSGVPEDFDVVEVLRAADEAASVSHDFIHDLNGVTREQASAAIWIIHNALRPLFEEDATVARFERGTGCGPYDAPSDPPHEFEGPTS